MEAPGRSLLSRPMILDHKERGNIVIHPFREKSVNTTSYDVRLGLYYYSEEQRGHGSNIFNPFDEVHVRRHWNGPHRGENAGEWMDRTSQHLENIKRDDTIIPLGPGQTILAHTQEFIGGRHCIGQEMRARSSMGRIGITVCKCAGWGDIGYVNRWTMEVTNVLQEHSITLVVGMRVAQLIFFEADPLDASYASEQGKYQTTDDMERLISSWSPESMLPKLYKDYELREGFPKQEDREAPILT